MDKTIEIDLTSHSGTQESRAKIISQLDRFLSMAQLNFVLAVAIRSAEEDLNAKLGIEVVDQTDSRGGKFIVVVGKESS